MHQNTSGGRLRPDPLGELKRSPRSPSRYKREGPPGRERRREWKGEGRGQEGEGEGKEWERREGEGEDWGVDLPYLLGGVRRH